MFSEDPKFQERLFSGIFIASNILDAASGIMGCAKIPNNDTKFKPTRTPIAAWLMSVL